MLCRPRETGQGLVEYGLLIGLIAVVVVAILAIFGNTAVTYLYSNIIMNF